jgi:hypothetical protein
MASYTTFFVAMPDEVVGGFPIWRPPSDDLQVEIARITKLAKRRSRKLPKYKTYVESWLPAFIRARPHLCVARLDLQQVYNLGAAIGSDNYFDSALCHPDSDDVMLQRFPPSQRLKLAAADEKALSKLAREWMAKDNFGKDESIQAPGFSEFTSADALNVLRRIANLAWTATDGQEMYAYAEEGRYSSSERDALLDDHLAINADLFDSHGFVFCFPLWSLKDSRLKDQGLPGMIPLVVTKDKSFVPLFSEERLANIFCDEMDVPEVDSIEIETQAKLLTYLEYFKGMEVELVGLDPAVCGCESRLLRYFPIQRLIDYFGGV